MPSMRSPVSAQPTAATARREAISTTLGTVADSIEAAGSAGRLVLVVSTQPEGPIAALIATHRRPVEQAVVGHHRLATAPGETRSMVTSRAARGTALGSIVWGIEEQTGRPASYDGPNMKWLMSSCERLWKSSASDFAPASVSKL